jgi:hypothetical protein
LTAKFLIACSSTLPPCWYRVNSCANNTLPNSETEAWFPSLAEVFGMSDPKANDLLLACGLMMWYGTKTRMKTESWKDLQIEYGLDIALELVTHAKFIGASKVLLVRIGSNVRDEAASTADASNFTLAASLKKIRAKTFRVPRMRMEAEKTAFGRNIAIHMPAKVSTAAASAPAAAAAVAVTAAASTATNSASASTAAAAAAAAAAAPTGVPGISSPPAVAPPTSRRHISVQINLDQKDIPLTVQGQNGAALTWVRVPTSSSYESCRTQFQFSNFIPHLLNAVADKDHGEEEAAVWLFTTMARKHPEGFEKVAQRLGYIPNPSAAKKTDRRRAAATAVATSATTPSATPATTAVATVNAVTHSAGQKRKASP